MKQRLKERKEYMKYGDGEKASLDFRLPFVLFVLKVEAKNV